VPATAQVHVSRTADSCARATHDTSTIVSSNAPEAAGSDDVAILFRDDHFVAVNKPAGLLLHRSPIDRHETRFALQIVRDMIGRRVYPVHRLDKATSGVLLFALTSQDARSVSEMFRSRDVAKTYVAVVRGYVAAEGTVDHALRERPDRLADRGMALDREAQPAVTRYRCLATVEWPARVSRYATSRYSLVELCPVTGRRHQLRRHMNHIAHPVIGDGRYGDLRHNRFFRSAFGCHRMLLAATAMSFRHPCTHEAIHIRAPLDSEFERLLARFGWSHAGETNR
jgi:tRNA pseudouridine65 synthase